MSLQLTNRDVANLIDALRTAINNNKVLIDSNLPPKSVPRKAWSEEDKENFAEWKGQLRWWRELRKRLLAHERAA